MAWVVVVGTVLRLLWVLLVHRPVEFDYSDMHTYMVGAQHFADAGYRFVANDWFYPSGTSAFLSLFVRVFGVPRAWTAAALAQALLSGLQIWLLFIAVRRFFGVRVAFVSATLLAFHYLAISYSGYFLSENWLTISLIGACAAFVPGQPLMCLLAGALLGLGAWAKPPSFLLALLWAAALGRLAPSAPPLGERRPHGGRGHGDRAAPLDLRLGEDRPPLFHFHERRPELRPRLLSHQDDRVFHPLAARGVLVRAPRRDPAGGAP
jgi:4-amino-4-deoxy-L-arabinose transferase-like glycosyltransferase